MMYTLEDVNGAVRLEFETKEEAFETMKEWLKDDERSNEEYVAGLYQVWKREGTEAEMIADDTDFVGRSKVIDGGVLAKVLSAKAFENYSNSDPLTVSTNGLTYTLSRIIERKGLSIEELNNLLEELSDE